MGEERKILVDVSASSQLEEAPAQDTLRRMFNLQPVLNHRFDPLSAPLPGFLKAPVSINQHQCYRLGWGLVSADAGARHQEKESSDGTSPAGHGLLLPPRHFGQSPGFWRAQSDQCRAPGCGQEERLNSNLY